MERSERVVTRVTIPSASLSTLTTCGQRY